MERIEGVEGADELLIGDKTSCFKRHLKTIIILLLIFILVIVTIILIFLLKKDKKNAFVVLFNDKDFIKPKIKLNAEFKLIKMNNGMNGLLINDPFAEFGHFNIFVPNGSYTETVPGLAHFSEHMIFGGSKRNNDIYTLLSSGFYNYKSNAYTKGELQDYYISVPYNFRFEKLIDILIDSFKYPLIDENIIKKEIQAVNSEFYFRSNNYWIRLKALLQELANPETSFYGMSSGNNETLRPNESQILAKKLKGYHMEVKNPKNIFFTLYSNLTMKKMEEIAGKYLNYEMHKFNDDEIDKEDIKKSKENFEKFQKLDIFDENLYKNGFFFNSNLPTNYLFLFFNIGSINFKDLQINIFDYYSYLFKSQSLINILIENNYISDFRIGNNGTNGK